MTGEQSQAILLLLKAANKLKIKSEKHVDSQFKEIVKNKILDMLSNSDFDHLVIETENTINHISKIRTTNNTYYFWVIKVHEAFQVNEIECTPKTYVLLESVVNEICTWLEWRHERVKKISTLLMFSIS